MLRRTHVEPFVREAPDGRLEVDFLRDAGGGRVARFLDRLGRLLRRLEGGPRHAVAEALRRQERRIRDSRRLAGICKTLTDLSRFRPVAGADRAPEIRTALFEARGRRWPPIPGDERLPYRETAERLGIDEADVDRLLYADDPRSYVLTRAPRLSGGELLARYNLDLARGVLLDAERLVVTAGGGWKDIFRAVKLARLMYRIESLGGGRHRLELTGPAAAFVHSDRRYGKRFVRVVPAVARAPGWKLEATVVRGDRKVPYVLSAETAAGRFQDWVVGRPSFRFDSAWERDLAAEFAEKLGEERDGWTLTREETPVALGQEVFLPDFTFRHDDGRTALVEVVGFWAPGYLERKLDQVRRAGLTNLVLVVYRELAAAEEELGEGAAEVVWFARKPLIGPVMEAVERVAVGEGTD